jgi:hypothetical protein
MEGIASGNHNRMTKTKLTKLIKSVVANPVVRNGALALLNVALARLTKKKP